MKGQALYFLWNLTIITVSQIVKADALPLGCYQSNYTSNYTRCDLTFMFCYSRKILQQCVMRKCQRYIRGAECYLQTGFILEQSKCYESCCGLSVFDEAACNKFNNDAADDDRKANTGLIVGILLINQLRYLQHQAYFHLLFGLVLSTSAAVIKDNFS